MTDSKQLHILKKLTDELEGISIANGYEFDMAGRVFRGRVIFGEDDPLPMLSIVEHLQPDINIDATGLLDTTRTETWILLVQGFIENTPLNPTDGAYQLKAAVEKRLSDLVATRNDTGNPVYPARYLLGLRKIVTKITIGPGIVSGPRNEIAATAFFYLPVGIGLALDLLDPYSPVLPALSPAVVISANEFFAPTVSQV